MATPRQEFMSNPTLVSGLREILDGEVFKEAQKVLASESPLKVRDIGAEPIRVLGRIEGFDDYESKLASLARHFAPQDILNDLVVDREEYAGN